MHAQSVQSVQMEEKQSELNEKDFELAKSLYLKMLDSPNFKLSDSMSQILAYNLRGQKYPRLSVDSLFIPWIKDNYHLTKFKSLDEAISVRDTWTKASNEVNKENMPLYDLLRRVSRKQLDVIMQPLLDRSRKFIDKY